MTPLVVDASVALKWVLVEPDSALAEQVLFRPLLAPEWWRVEVANGLWKALDRGEIDLGEARAGLARFADVAVETDEAPGLLDEAMVLAARLRHAIYDCLYLALAIRRDTRMVTADAQFVKAALRAGPDLAARVVLLADFSE
ncbi:MAG: type II toxin-antitoxin system VapC family toxin [Brevundimonas sp.]